MIVAVLWGAATITFIAVKAIPGDPVAVLTGGENIVDAAEREALIRQFGLDQPLAVLINLIVDALYLLIDPRLRRAAR